MTPAWSFYPELHTAVQEQMADTNHTVRFYNMDQTHCKNQYDTHIMGRFECKNDTCGAKGWTSKIIAITIRQYTRNRYNVRVWNQSCKHCKQRGQAIIDVESYAERVAYRLKKWYGYSIERPDYKEKKGDPHETKLCEGCKAGHCQIAKIAKVDSITAKLAQLRMGEE